MYRSNFCDVAYSEELNAAYVTWKAFCSGEDYREPLRFALSLMEQHGGCSYIADTRDGFENNPADTKWLEETFLPCAQEAGCKHIFFIIHPDGRLKEELDGQAGFLGKHFRVHYCFSLDEVKQILKQGLS